MSLSVADRGLSHLVRGLVVKTIVARDCIDDGSQLDKIFVSLDAVSKPALPALRLSPLVVAAGGAEQYGGVGLSDGFAEIALPQLPEEPRGLADIDAQSGAAAGSPVAPSLALLEWQSFVQDMRDAAAARLAKTMETYSTFKLFDGEFAALKDGIVVKDKLFTIAEIKGLMMPRMNWQLRTPLASNLLFLLGSRRRVSVRISMSRLAVRNGSNRPRRQRKHSRLLKQQLLRRLIV